jgi:hypothetical protein
MLSAVISTIFVSRFVVSMFPKYDKNQVIF